MKHMIRDVTRTHRRPYCAIKFVSSCLSRTRKSKIVVWRRAGLAEFDLCSKIHCSRVEHGWASASGCECRRAADGYDAQTDPDDDHRENKALVASTLKHLCLINKWRCTHDDRRDLKIVFGQWKATRERERERAGDYTPHPPKRIGTRIGFCKGREL